MNLDDFVKTLALHEATRQVKQLFGVLELYRTLPNNERGELANGVSANLKDGGLDLTPVQVRGRLDLCSTLEPVQHDLKNGRVSFISLRTDGGYETFDYPSAMLVELREQDAKLKAAGEPECRCGVRHEGGKHSAATKH